MTITKKAIFAGGCFWCMVKPFNKYDGVLEENHSLKKTEERTIDDIKIYLLSIITLSISIMPTVISTLATIPQATSISIFINISY